MPVYLAPISNGLGDLICSLPVLQSLIATGRETYLVHRSAAQAGLDERIEGLAGSIDENALDALPHPYQLINLRNHPLQTDHIWGSPEFVQKYPHLFIDEIIERIARDNGVETAHRPIQPLRFESVETLREKVIFIPGSRGSQKCWPTQHWQRLAQLLKGAGLDYVIIGEPGESAEVKKLVDSGMNWFATPTIGSAVDALSTASAVVGVDTGIMHIAVQQLRPTVALFRYNALFARKKSHVRSLLAPLCDQVCLSKEFDSVGNKQISYKTSDKDDQTPGEFYWTTWGCGVSAEEHCMTKIAPADVWKNLQEILA